MIHRYRFISEHHATYGVTRLCRVLAVTASAGLLRVARRPTSPPGTRRGRRGAGRRDPRHPRRAPGLLRLTARRRELRRRGPAGQPQARRADHAGAHIVGITRRRRRSLTKQDTAAAPAPDLIGRDFTAPAPGQRFVGDITYLPTQEGWLYLATTIDLFNREVVGYAMADHMRAELVSDAVELAHRRGLVATAGDLPLRPRHLSTPRKSSGATLRRSDDESVDGPGRVAATTTPLPNRSSQP